MARPPKTPPASARAQRVAEMQRKEKGVQRRRLSVLWIALGVVLALVIGAVAWAIASRPSLEGVQVYEEVGAEPVLSRDHVSTPVTYEQTPPVGGDHHPTWWNCGVYEQQLPDHHVVHSLEHGAVWLTYQPGLPEDQLEQLRELADQDFVLLSPYEGQPAQVMATAWGHQLSVEDLSASREQLELFIREYRQGPQTPEPGAACTGGTTTDLIGG
jgi:Protein of unknown function (DUF3105)